LAKPFKPDIVHRRSKNAGKDQIPEIQMNDLYGSLPLYYTRQVLKPLDRAVASHIQIVHDTILS
ncbi:MAG: hypothetical protein AMK69_03550, partial [Nitrospira bacterium SG8_3]